MSLAEPIQTETQPYTFDAPERLVIVGTDASSRTDLCTVVVLAVHELVTTASKYGALSNETGVIEVTFETVARGLQLTRREVGGPLVTPPGRKGFGRELIEGAIPYELG